jgi:xylan 1,4-beta-xylosidase
LPTARVGGADSAGSGGKFTRDFIEHCLHGTNYATGQVGTPLDFISFHAKGSPTTTNGHVRMGIANQLRNIDDGFRIVASYPELKGKPIVIGESDPEGCAACQGATLAYRNGTMYSSYTASVFARKHELARQHGVNLEGALTWAFEFEDQPYFAGFRSLASNGIDKPVLNVFRMFAKMSGQQLTVTSDAEIPLEQMMRSGVREKPDVAALASLDGKKLSVLVWHYHDDDVPGAVASVELALNDLPVANGPVSVRQFLIDENHSNAFTAWKKMGSPQSPSRLQYVQLERAGRLADLGETQISVLQKKTSLRFALPRQAVSLLVFEW